MTSRVNNADETKLRRNENINYSLYALAGIAKTGTVPRTAQACAPGLRYPASALPGLFDRLYASAHCTGLGGGNLNRSLIRALRAPIDETLNCARASYPHSWNLHLEMNKSDGWTAYRTESGQII